MLRKDDVEKIIMLKQKGYTKARAAAILSRSYTTISKYWNVTDINDVPDKVARFSLPSMYHDEIMRAYATLGNCVLVRKYLREKGIDISLRTLQQYTKQHAKKENE